MVDTAKLRGDRLAEFERDREESNRRYDHAFRVVLSHTSAVELEEFWQLFSSSTDQLEGGGSAEGERGKGAAASDHFGFENPMTSRGGSSTLAAGGGAPKEAQSRLL